MLILKQVGSLMIIGLTIGVTYNFAKTFTVMAIEKYVRYLKSFGSRDSDSNSNVHSLWKMERRFK